MLDPIIRLGKYMPAHSGRQGQIRETRGTSGSGLLPGKPASNLIPIRTSRNVSRNTIRITSWRSALGASRGDLIWMVVRDVLAPVVVGLAVGVPAVIALAQLVRSLLYGVGPADPSTIACAALLMCVVAAAAAYLPARRATKADPMVALRFE